MSIVGLFLEKMIKVVMLLLFVFLLCKLPTSEGKLFGDHVCQTEIMEPEEVLRWELTNRTVRTYTWCMNVPPRCSVYSYKLFNETKTAIINVTKSIEVCCEGFREQNGYCTSLCQTCVNGLCLNGTCICQSGWNGTNCDSRVMNYGEDIISEKPTHLIINITNVSTTHAPTKSLNVEAATNTASITQTSKTSLNEENATNTTSIIQHNLLATITDDEPYQSSLEKYTTSPTHRPSTLTTSTVSFTDKTIISIYDNKNILKPSQQDLLNTTLPHTLGSNEKIDDASNSPLGREPKEFKEDLDFQYSTEGVFLDTTVTKQIDASTTEQIKNTENSENSAIDIDYRELGGESFEEESLEPPKVLTNNVNSNIILLNIIKTNGSNKSFENSRSMNEHIQVTTWNTVPVLIKPAILKDENENTIFKDDFKNSLADNKEERSQKRTFNDNYNPNTILTKNEPDNNNLIYSVCAASATTLLILIVAVTIFAVRNAKKKMQRKKGKKDVATVAVYTTSIFHSPLPEPPTFDNPTYLSTIDKEPWREQNEESIEVQEFNVVFQKPIQNQKLECKQYVYDHPPSTGSYRASSDIDTLSQYNLSRKSLSGIILEPVYDEIPSRDNPVDPKDSNDISSECSNNIGRKDPRTNVDNNCLYVNTFGRTMF